MHVFKKNRNDAHTKAMGHLPSFVLSMAHALWVMISFMMHLSLMIVYVCYHDEDDFYHIAIQCPSACFLFVVMDHHMAPSPLFLSLFFVSLRGKMRDSACLLPPQPTRSFLPLLPSYRGFGNTQGPPRLSRSIAWLASIHVMFLSRVECHANGTRHLLATTSNSSISRHDWVWFF